MLIGKLELRYLFVGLAIAGTLFVSACRQNREAVRYQTVPLVQGTRSFGMPLAGIAVDADRHDVYAIVGGGKGNDARQNFVILWKGKEGGSYCATISAQGDGLDSVSEILPEGGMRKLYDLARKAPPAVGEQEEHPVSSDGSVQSIIEALPAGSGFHDTQ